MRLAIQPSRIISRAHYATWSAEVQRLPGPSHRLESPSHQERDQRTDAGPSRPRNIRQSPQAETSTPPSYFSFRSQTSKSHQYPPGSPYAAVLALPRNSDARTAIDMLPEGPVPPYVLSVILGMKLSIGDMADILPLLSTPLASLTQSRARLDALALFLAACVRLRGYIFLPPAVGYALETMGVLDTSDKKKAKSEGEAAGRMLARYHRLLTVMVGREGNRLRSLPPPLRDRVSAIVVHALSELDSMGSSLATRPSTLSAFFGPFLTQDTVSHLVSHVKRHGIQLEEWHWRHAAIVSPHSMEYVAAAAAAHDENPATSDVHPVHRLMAAQETRSLRDALRAVGPLISGGDTSRRLEPTLERLDSVSTTPASASTPASTSPSTSTSTPTSTSTSTSTFARQSKQKQPAVIDDSLSRAWSILLTRAGADPAVSNDDLIALAGSMPESAVCAATVTPTIHALVQRDEALRALDIWRSLRDRYAHASPKTRPNLLDAPLLTAAAEMRSRLQSTDSVHDAVKTVDYYALRPGRPAKVRHSVPIDVGTLNCLLRICSRETRPSIAFRLFASAESRWGILPDDISLATLLDCARYAALPPDTMEDRVRMMRDAFSFAGLGRLVGKNPTYVQNALPHQTRALLDPPGYTWHGEYGSARPVDLAKSLFEEVLSNWDLNGITSPLSHGRMDDLRSYIAPLSLPGPPAKPTPVNGKYPHLIPRTAWGSYIKLLAYNFPEVDLGHQLAYMRSLGVVPSWETLLVALKGIGETEGPRRRVSTGDGTRLMRDEEVVRAYLSSWLPAVPSEEEVAHFRRGKEMAHALRQRR